MGDKSGFYERNKEKIKGAVIGGLVAGGLCFILNNCEGEIKKARQDIANCIAPSPQVKERPAQPVKKKATPSAKKATKPQSPKPGYVAPVKGDITINYLFAKEGERSFRITTSENQTYADVLRTLDARTGRNGIEGMSARKVMTNIAGFYVLNPGESRDDDNKYNILVESTCNNNVQRMTIDGKKTDSFSLYRIRDKTELLDLERILKNFYWNKEITYVEIEGKDGKYETAAFLSVDPKSLYPLGKNVIGIGQCGEGAAVGGGYYGLYGYPQHTPQIKHVPNTWPGSRVNPGDAKRGGGPEQRRR